MCWPLPAGTGDSETQQEQSNLLDPRCGLASHLAAAQLHDGIETGAYPGSGAACAPRLRRNLRARQAREMLRTQIAHLSQGSGPLQQPDGHVCFRSSPSAQRARQSPAPGLSCKSGWAASPQGLFWACRGPIPALGQIPEQPAQQGCSEETCLK